MSIHMGTVSVNHKSLRWLRGEDGASGGQEEHACVAQSRWLHLGKLYTSPQAKTMKLICKIKHLWHKHWPILSFTWKQKCHHCMLVLDHTPFSSRRSSVRRGGTQEAEGDTKSAGQGQPGKLITFSLTLCRGAIQKRLTPRRQVFFLIIILRSSFQNKFSACYLFL